MLELDLESSMQNTNEETKEFLKELEDSLEKNKSIELTYLDSMLKENNVLQKYKTQMYEERSNILKEYATKTEDKGYLYYIYDMDYNRNLYNVAVYNSYANSKMTISSNSLPEGSKVRNCI